MNAPKANPYQREGAWFFEVGPFANASDALRDLLGRSIEYERLAAEAAEVEEPPQPAREPSIDGAQIIPFKPRTPLS